MITADAYWRTAIERADEARMLHQQARYALAHYTAGLAVECVLRAYRLRIDPRFDARHDLRELCRQARFYSSLRPQDAKRIGQSLGDIYVRWRNDHRYRDERELRHWLREHVQDRRVKGDVLKYSSARVVAAAIDVVTTGRNEWERGS